MPLFVALGKLTEGGATYLRDLALRHRHAVANVERGGGKVVASYALLGPYDFLVILDCPDERVAMKILAKESSHGNVRYETMTALPIEEFAKLVQE
jgi:uncharacterized protein with GYD domain